jgi:hypothetical protein
MSILDTITSNEALIKWRVASSDQERLVNDKEAAMNELAGLMKNLEDWDGAKILF